MNILFLHTYSEKNTGDAAIVSVMLHHYREKYPDATITLSSITKQKNKSFEDAPYISSFFQEAIYSSHQNKNRVWMTLWVIIGILFHGWFYKIFKKLFPFFFSPDLQEFEKTVLHADLVVGVGGGYILGKNNTHDTVSLILTLLEFWFCKQLGKRVELEAMSIGPFGTAFQTWLAKKILNTLDVIHVREKISFNLLKKLEIIHPSVKKSVDLAFYFQPKTKTKMRNYLMKRGVFFNKPVLGITVKKCFHDDQQQRYEDAIAEFVNKVTENSELKVIFIPHVTAKLQNDDDRDVIQSIKPKLKYKDKVILLMDEYSFRDIKGIYENLTWLVGTRMHSVIFSVTANIPVIALAYEPKTIGIMTTLDLQKHVLPVENLTSDQLLKLYRTL